MNCLHPVIHADAIQRQELMAELSLQPLGYQGQL